MAHSTNGDLQSLPFTTEIDLPNAWSDPVRGPGAAMASPTSQDHTPEGGASTDVLNRILSTQTKLVTQNNTILDQVARISSDVSRMNRDLAKMSRIVSKLDIARERDSHAANVLRCEFQTFSWKTINSLKLLSGDKTAGDSEQGKHEQLNVYFCGEDDVFSNFYYSPLYVLGLKFQTAEHLYQFKKADFHGLEDSLCSDIINAHHGGAAKAAANHHIQEVSQEWEEERANAMLEVIRVKAAQCPEFREKLLATGDRGLFHSLSSYVWGWGSRGQGQNLMGNILEQVRLELTQGSIQVDNLGLGNDTEVQRGAAAVENTRAERHDTRNKERDDERGSRGQETSPKRGRKRGDSRGNREGNEGYKYNHVSKEQSLQIEDDWPSLPQSGTILTSSSGSPKRRVTSGDGRISVKVSNKKDKETKEDRSWRSAKEEDQGGDGTMHQQHQGQSHARGVMRTGPNAKGSNRKRAEKAGWGEFDNSNEYFTQSYAAGSMDHESEPSRDNKNSEEHSNLPTTENYPHSTEPEDTSYNYNRMQSRHSQERRGRSNWNPRGRRSSGRRGHNHGSWGRGYNRYDSDNSNNRTDRYGHDSNYDNRYSNRHSRLSWHASRHENYSMGSGHHEQPEQQEQQEQQAPMMPQQRESGDIRESVSVPPGIPTSPKTSQERHAYNAPETSPAVTQHHVNMGQSGDNCSVTVDNRHGDKE